MLCVSTAAPLFTEETDAMDLEIEQAVEEGANTFFFSHHHNTTDVPANLIALRSQLEILHIDNNYNLTAITPRVTALTQLRWLNASYCAVSSIDPSISRLSKLERLTLNNNNLSWLPLEMWQMKELEEMDLGNNKLRVLPDCLLFLPKLRSVTLENNPLFSRETVDGAAAVTYIPPQRSVDCSACCTRTRHYQVFVTFHSFMSHRDVPFVHFTCSDECSGHVRTRLQRYDELH